MKKWKVISRSAIGIGHKKQQIPCQDYGDYCLLEEDILLGAIADGAGSAKHSEAGAKIAVEVSLKYLEKFTSGGLHESYPPSSHLQAQKIFAKLLAEVIDAFKKEAMQKSYSITDLACTLLAFIATPQKLVAMQLGDGFMVVRPPHGKLQLLFRPDKGEYINETTFVTSSNALEAMQVAVINEEFSFICAATDGLEKVAIQLRDWLPFAHFFEPLEQYLQETPNPEEDEEYIQTFLNSERLNARTDDDKTLLLSLLTS